MLNSEISEYRNNSAISNFHLSIKFSNFQISIFKFFTLQKYETSTDMASRTQRNENSNREQYPYSFVTVSFE